MKIVACLLVEVCVKLFLGVLGCWSEKMISRDSCLLFKNLLLRFTVFNGPKGWSNYKIMNPYLNNI